MQIGAGNDRTESRSSQTSTRNSREMNSNNRNQQREGSVSDLQDEEAISQHSSDHPGMVLVSVPLTGNNFLSWNRFIRIALGAKIKLCFIDGSCPPPSLDSPQFSGWKKAGCMVLSWLLNSISNDIVESLFTQIQQEICGRKSKHALEKAMVH